MDFIYTMIMQHYHSTSHQHIFTDNICFNCSDQITYLYIDEGCMKTKKHTHTHTYNLSQAFHFTPHKITPLLGIKIQKYTARTLAFQQSTHYSVSSKTRWKPIRAFQFNRKTNTNNTHYCLNRMKNVK